MEMIPEALAIRFREAVLSSHLIGVVTHRNADPDAVASLEATMGLASRMGAQTYCVLPEGMSQASKRLAERLGARLDCGTSPLEDTDLLVVLDTASRSQLGEAGALLERTPYLLIDHHSQNSLVEASALALYVPEASSTSEIVALLYEALGIEPDPLTCSMLMAGMIYDSRRFAVTGPHTFRAAALLYRCCDYDAVLEALRGPGPEFPERVARLKAASRLRLYRMGDILVAVTHVSAYESSAARGLLDLGADIAIVASNNNGELRIVGRARGEVPRSLGLSLGKDVMAPLARAMGGTGGGHDAAAAATGKGSLDEALSRIAGLLEEISRRRGWSFRELA